MFAAKTLDLVHTILSALVVMGPTKESFYIQAHTYRRLSLHMKSQIILSRIITLSGPSVLSVGFGTTLLSQATVPST